MAIDTSHVVTDAERLEEALALITKLKQQHRISRNRLLSAYGMASSFKMLDPQSSDKAGEIHAAKHTGHMLEEQLRDALFADNDANKDY
jgi:hypothetical protein